MTEHDRSPAADSEDRSMRSIRSRLGVVRRRLHANRFLEALFLDLLVALGVFAVYLLVHQLIAVPVSPLHVFAGLIGASLLLSLIRGGLLGRASLFGAAVVADEKLALKERVSSAVYLEENRGRRGDGDVEGWQELIERDGARAISNAPLGASFPVRLPRTALWALGVLLLTLLIPIAVEQQDLLGWRTSREAHAKMREEVTREIEDLTQSEEFTELEQLAADSEDPAMKELLEAIRKLEEEQAKNEEQTPGADVEKEAGDAVKKDALVKLSRLEDLIKEQANRGDFEKLREFLDDMRAARIDPSAETAALQKALKDGDLAKAGEALDKLAEKLKELEEKQKSGALSEEELERLKKLKRELGALGRSSAMLSKLGNGLGGLSGLDSQNLSQRDLAQMLQNLDQMSLSLQSLQQLMKQMQTLQQSLDQLQLAKLNTGQMHQCPNCGKLRKGPMQPGGT